MKLYTDLDEKDFRALLKECRKEWVAGLGCNDGKWWIVTTVNIDLDVDGENDR